MLVKFCTVTSKHACAPFITLLWLPTVKDIGVGVPLLPNVTVPGTLLNGTFCSAVLMTSILVGVPVNVTCVEPVLANALKHKVNSVVPLATVTPV